MSFNSALVQAFANIAKLIEVLGEDSFRAAAHAKAARILEGLTDDLEPTAKSPDAKKQLQAIEGIGPKIADKIIEFAASGRIKELDDLRAKVPAGLVPLLDISGLGPKTVSMLWNQGGVTDLAGLKAIIADGSIINLPRMGEKAVEKIKASIALAEQGLSRMSLGPATIIAEKILERVRTVEGVTSAAFAGSLRRGKETIGDIDILVATTNHARVVEAFCAQPEVRQILARGESKCSVRFDSRVDHGRWSSDSTDSAGDASNVPTIQVDLRVIDKSAWGAALMYFTGSKEHNVKLRERAQKLKLTLNEYGLFPDEPGHDLPPQNRGIKPIASASEREVFEALGEHEIPPELREDRGELDAFALKPPKALTPPQQAPVHLIEISDIKAELHAHTTASDGVMSILELASQAKARGMHTIAVTDHSKSSAIAGGLSPERLRAHIQAVHAARAQIKDITILSGSEVDILSDGTLDYDDELLALLDVVVASPHAALSQEPALATSRLLKAITHPMVHILGHPTGRLINRRAGLAPDMPALIAAAKSHNVALEINAHWMRLDLRDTHVRAAHDAGALIAIDCDVHSPDDFDNLRFGVQTARRGWLERDACINTWPAKKLHEWLKAKRA